MNLNRNSEKTIENTVGCYPKYSEESGLQQNFENKARPKMITEYETGLFEIDDFPDYLFEIAHVPANLPWNHPARLKFDDRNHAPNTRGSLFIHIYERQTSKFAGYVVFQANEPDLKSDCVVIYEPHRRKGLATFCYDLAEEYFEITVSPSELITDDGELFWADRRSKWQPTAQREGL